MRWPRSCSWRCRRNAQRRPPPANAQRGMQMHERLRRGNARRTGAVPTFWYRSICSSVSLQKTQTSSFAGRYCEPCHHEAVPSGSEGERHARVLGRLRRARRGADLGDDLIRSAQHHRLDALEECLRCPLTHLDFAVGRIEVARLADRFGVLLLEVLWVTEAPWDGKVEESVKLVEVVLWRGMVFEVLVASSRWCGRRSCVRAR